MRGTLLELVAALIVSGVVAVAGLALIDRTSLPAFTTSHVARSLTTVGQVVAVAVIIAAIALLRRDKDSRWGKTLSWAGLSGFATVTLAMPLSATKLYLFGISVDQEFRTQFFTRMTATPRLQDMNYADLPSYYPAGWFWFGGRSADLLGMPGWEMYKPYAIATLALAIVASTVLWSRLVRADLAVVVGLAQGAIALAYGSPEPYGAIVALLLPPVLVLAWSGLRRSAAQSRSGPGATQDPTSHLSLLAAGHPIERAEGRWPAIVGVGIFLGLSATIYTLYTGLAAFTVVLMAATVIILAMRSHVQETGDRRLSAATLRAAVVPLIRLAVITVIACAIALVVWSPYLIAAASKPSEAATAMRYLPESGSALPLPMLHLNLIGILCAIGFLWILTRARNSVRAQAFGVGVVSIYLWSLLSMAFTVIGTTLLGFRLEPVLLLLLGVAGVFGVFDVASWAVRRAQLYQVADVARVRSRQVRVTVIAIGVIAALSFIQGIPRVLATEISTAYSDTDGNGQRADRYAPGAASYFAEVDEAIRTQVATPVSDTVVLTTDFSFLSFNPYLGFQALTSHYANPLGLFNARSAAINDWSKSTDAADLIRQLDASPWRAPQAFVFRTTDDAYTLRLSADVYPNNPNVKLYTVAFPKKLFDSPEFSTENIGPFTVIVRK
ncbi:galactan 5-O-arabinofuranosyltransferase [Tomitella biformata]|nr:galactan 5-O-arabinofuranosyltransferase [Tomitella biformata]